MPIKEMFQGFCMALADSVPGVSGGSIAFIMGFYEKFIGSLNGIFSRDRNERREGFKFLIKLFAGWIIGMGLAVVALSNLFETHIYGISSLFLGFILVSIVVMMADPEMRRQQRGLAKWICLAAGAALVVVITVLHPNSNAALTGLSPASAIYIFIAGAAAISAMVLPGISGSTLLLVFGLYLPVIHGLKAAMTMNFAAMWACHALIYGMTGLLITLRIHLCISRKPWFRGVTAILCLAMCAFCWLYPLSVRAHSVSWIMFASSAVDWLWSLFQSKRRK